MLAMLDMGDKESDPYHFLDRLKDKIAVLYVRCRLICAVFTILSVSSSFKVILAFLFYFQSNSRPGICR